MSKYSMTRNTFTMESCFWITEGKREICITYKYFPYNGDIHYAACIFRKENYKSSITQKNVLDTEHTTTKRFEIRPVVTKICSNASHHYIIKSIRYLMCQKYGCKGERIIKTGNKNRTYSESTNDYLSDISDISLPSYLESIDISKYTDTISQQLLDNGESVIYSKYFHSDNYKKLGYHRAIYIAFKGNPENGDLIYAAAINHDIRESDTYTDELNHYNTALMRLKKTPIYINIPAEFKYQIDSKKTNHFEDITQIIVDNIFNRKQGRLQIKNNRKL